MALANLTNMSNFTQVLGRLKVQIQVQLLILIHIRRSYLGAVTVFDSLRPFLLISSRPVEEVIEEVIKVLRQSTAAKLTCRS